MILPPHPDLLNPYHPVPPVPIPFLYMQERHNNGIENFFRFMQDEYYKIVEPSSELKIENLAANTAHNLVLDAEEHLCEIVRQVRKCDLWNPLAG